MRIYLAGPIAGLTYEGCTGWRDEVAAELYRFMCYSPMRGKGYLKEVGEIGTQRYQQVLSTDKAIYVRDRMDVLEADLVICNLLGATKASIGTMFELAWASLNNIPVIGIMEKEGNVHDHPFVREAVGFRVETLREAMALAHFILMPI